MLQELCTPTHASERRTQVQVLCQAWAWQQEDRILHALPLHHVYCIINTLLCTQNSNDGLVLQELCISSRA